MVDDVDVDIVEDDFGVEKEDKIGEEMDKDIGMGIGSYRNASEKVRGCTLARY